VKISDSQIQAVLTSGGQITPDAVKVETTVIRLVDAELIEQTAKDVLAMPDREEMIANLKARIEAGEYNPTGQEIADSMVRRMMADRIR
jgi:negative regulator of flagellin synthesis FlgM